MSKIRSYYDKLEHKYYNLKNHYINVFVAWRHLLRSSDSHSCNNDVSWDTYLEDGTYAVYECLIERVPGQNIKYTFYYFIENKYISQIPLLNIEKYEKLIWSTKWFGAVMSLSRVSRPA